MGNTWGEGRGGSRLNGAEACKVSVVWGDYRRPLVVLGDGIGLLSPPPFSPWICALTLRAWGRRRKVKTWRGAYLSVSLYPGEISASTTPWPQSQGSGTSSYVGREMSALRVAQVAQTAYSHPFPEKGQTKTGTSAKAAAARADHSFTATCSACAWTLPSWSEGERMNWNDKCVCVSTHNKGYLLALETVKWAGKILLNNMRCRSKFDLFISL